MGTYIKFRVDEARRKKAGAWLRKVSANKLGLWDERDQKIERAKPHGQPDYLPLGVGQHKLSGGCESDEEASELITTLILAKIKYGLECFDVPSNVGDYISDIHLPQLIDLPHWKAVWEAEEAEEVLWAVARKKAQRGARKAHPGGVGVLVKTWSDSLAHLVCVDIAPSEFAMPRWWGVSYDQKGRWAMSLSPRPGERFELHHDDKHRGFLAIPMMALVARGAPGGYDDVWAYLARAQDIGLRTDPDEIMEKVYHIAPTTKTARRRASKTK